MKTASKEFIKGSEAIAKAIFLARPEVISAYPITPQTHIMETLEKYSLKNKRFRFIQADSELAAASMVLGASAAGARAYTASSSQGLLLMAEALYNIAGLRLPVVMTVANRAISGPINIWNDHSDAMAVRDSTWIMLFAENSQETIDLQIAAFAIAEKTQLPVMVNVDGFLITHAFEEVEFPRQTDVDKFLGKRKVDKNNVLAPKSPLSLGTLFLPEHYGSYRKNLGTDLSNAHVTIEYELQRYAKICHQTKRRNLEYYGPKNPQKIILAIGSIIGTIKAAVEKRPDYQKIGIIKIVSYRPFPSKEIKQYCLGAKKVIILEKVSNYNNFGPLAQDVLTAGVKLEKIKSFAVGLGGEDVSEEQINKIINSVKI